MSARGETQPPGPATPGPQVQATGAAIAPSPARRGGSLMAPLRASPLFRTIWAASLLSNFGQLIQGVGAAWAMTRMTGSASMVALVQTAIMLPLMLVALPAGAIADMFDRRLVALTGLGFACLSAAGLTGLAVAGLVGPWTLLGFCFLIGVGVALFGPAWQSSVGEQVAPEHLPAAVALGSISYNVARSFGPAVGGLIVASLGAVAAFATNAICYLPLIGALLRWRRAPVPARLPPERFDRAIISGTRYVIHSPPIRVLLARTLVSGFGGASVSALTPLVARDLLHGSAGTYGLLLGAFGVGAVGGATLIDRLRAGLSAEAGVRLCALVAGAMIVVVGLSRHVALSCAALAVAGSAWMLLIALFNIGVQLSAPRWVTARALAWFSTAITGGMASGAFVWGRVGQAYGIDAAMVASGGMVMLTPLLGLVLRMPQVVAAEIAGSERDAPAIGLALTPRSGPIILEIDYRVDPAEARDFYAAMQAVRRARLRSGGFDWSLARDVADPALWTERYHCPTWRDYLRQRDRLTRSDYAAQAKASAFDRGEGDQPVRRRLERPFGSVRWHADTPDPGNDRVDLYRH